MRTLTSSKDSSRKDSSRLGGKIPMGKHSLASKLGGKLKTDSPLIDPNWENWDEDNLDYDDDPEAEMYWMQYSDFYDWPYIQHFDDYEHLKQLILKANLHEISENIKREVNIKRLKVSRTWCDIMERVKS